MFDSHDDDLWEVPSIDVNVPVEAVPAVEAVPVPEAVAAAPVEAVAPAEDEPSTDDYVRPWPRLPRTTVTTWMDWTASCSSTLVAKSCARTSRPLWAWCQRAHLCAGVPAGHVLLNR